MNTDKDSSAYTHAVMFHHFHDERHPVGQGSLSADQFEDMIDWLDERHTLLNADEYLHKLKNNQLAATDICLSFDDALLCQSEIAAPILNRRKIQAFFFVYSSPFMGNPDYLEIYRYFRSSNFKSMDDFYEQFFQKAGEIFASDCSSGLAGYDGKEYLKAFPFYSENDKLFRYLRDQVLGKEKYEEIMRLMMLEHGFEPEAIMKQLWMNDKSLSDLVGKGHIVGLHSYSHPTTLHLLDKETQEKEYKENHRHLSELLNISPFAMSHPCGNYNDDTLGILNSQNIGIGFRSNNSIKQIKSHLEVPREDHANVLKEMNK